VIEYDPELLQWIYELKISPRDDYGIWMIETKFHKFMLNTVNPSEYNLRILRVRRQIQLGMQFPSVPAAPGLPSKLVGFGLPKFNSVTSTYVDKLTSPASLDLAPVVESYYDGSSFRKIRKWHPT